MGCTRVSRPPILPFIALTVSLHRCLQDRVVRFKEREKRMVDKMFAAGTASQVVTATGDGDALDVTAMPEVDVDMFSRLRRGGDIAPE